MFKIDIHVGKQSLFRQVPKRGGQKICCSCCASWLAWFFYICCSELGRTLVEHPRKDGNFLSKPAVVSRVRAYKHCTPRSNCSPMLLQNKARCKGQSKSTCCFVGKEFRSVELNEPFGSYLWTFMQSLLRENRAGLKQSMPKWL